MTLSDQLLNFQKQFQAQAPQDVQEMMMKATEDLASSGITDRVLEEGDSFPDGNLLDASGKEVAMSSFLKDGPVVICFYRGGWCPYCNIQLASLQKHLPDFKALGVQLTAITPEKPEKALSTSEKNELSFPVLTDVGNAYAKSLGLVFTLPESLRPIYKQFGIDIPSHNGDETFELPLAATFVVNKEGKVTYRFVDADYTKRAEPNDILEALK